MKKILLILLVFMSCSMYALHKIRVLLPLDKEVELTVSDFDDLEAQADALLSQGDEFTLVGVLY